MEKPKKGQVAWIKQKDHRGVSCELKEVVIKSVGNKYFYLDGNYSRIKFDIKTGIEVSNYTSIAKVYLNKQIYLDEKEFSILYDRIKGVFRSWSNNNISLEKLRQIETILTPQ